MNTAIDFVTTLDFGCKKIDAEPAVIRDERFNVIEIIDASVLPRHSEEIK